MLLKIIIGLFLLAIVYTLGSSFIYLIRGNKDQTKMAKSLTWRITFSIILFIILCIGYKYGWLHPVVE